MNYTQIKMNEQNKRGKLKKKQIKDEEEEEEERMTPIIFFFFLLRVFSFIQSEMFFFARISHRIHHHKIQKIIINFHEKMIIALL